MEVDAFQLYPLIIQVQTVLARVGMNGEDIFAFKIHKLGYIEVKRILTIVPFAGELSI